MTASTTGLAPRRPAAMDRAVGADRPDEVDPASTDGTASAATADRRPRMRWAIVGALLIVALAGWMIRAQARADAHLDLEQQAAFEDVTGIRVLRVVMTAGGGLVELQYQILDPDKSLAIHDDEAPPGLIDERTGTVVAIPFHEHKSRELHTAVTYREIFMNGDGVLERGSKVTLQVGDAVLEHIEVG